MRAGICLLLLSWWPNGWNKLIYLVNLQIKFKAVVRPAHQPAHQTQPLSEIVSECEFVNKIEYRIKWLNVYNMLVKCQIKIIIIEIKLGAAKLKQQQHVIKRTYVFGISWNGQNHQPSILFCRLSTTTSRERMAVILFAFERSPSLDLIITPLSACCSPNPPARRIESMPFYVSSAR